VSSLDRPNVTGLAVVPTIRAVGLTAELRHVSAAALAVDRGGFQPLLGLRAAAGVALPILIGSAAGHLTDGVIAAAGALPPGIAGMTGGFRSRTGVIAVVSIGTGVSTFVGGLVAGHLAPTLVVLAVWGAAAGLLVSLGREATIVGTQAVVGLAVFGRFPGSVSTSALHAGWVFAGGALQGVLVAVFRPPGHFGRERQVLAHAYLSLAALAHDVHQPGLPAGTAVEEAAELVSRRHGDDVDALRGLVDEADRIRLELQSLATFPRVDGVTDVTRAAASWLRRIGQAVRDVRPPTSDEGPLAQAVERLRQARADAPAGPSGVPTRYAAARSVALLGQLRAAERLAGLLAGVDRLTLPHIVGADSVMRLPGRVGSGLRRVALTARDRHAPAFRHAVRLAVVLPLAEGLSHALPGQRGYWVTLTALVVLRPDYAATMQRGLARVIGTGLGVVLAGLIVVAVHPSGTAVTLLVFGFAWASYASFGASYAVYSFLITGLVVLLIAPTGPNAISTVGDRGLDTLVGGALALVAYAVWPTWEGGATADAQSALLRGLADYADLVLGGYVDPQAVDASALARQATVLRRARATAIGSLERAAAEPERLRGDTDRAARVMAATRRIVVTLHALRTTLQDATERPPVPEVAAARDAVVAALRGLAGSDCSALTGLREHQQSLEDAARSQLETLHARRLAVVAAHLDPLVDAIDTAGHVICGQAAATVGA
jgi:uncharacterized membrane protein YccC